MKITVKNLGAVEQAEIDLKPLTVFVGHNGTGKTWTAYALASIFSQHGYEKYLVNYLDGKNQTYPILDKAIEQFLKEGSAEIDIVQFAKENIQTYINDVASLAPHWMHSYLSTRRINFETLSLQINFQGSEKKIEKEINEYHLDIDFSIFSKNINLYKEKNSKQVFFSMESKKKTEKQIPIKRLKYFICAGVFAVLHRSLFSSTYLFPTERTTFITLPIRDGKIREANGLEQTKETFNKLDFIHPIQNFINMISTASSIHFDDREDDIKGASEIKDYMDLAVFLEEKILQGKSNFEKAGVEKELLFSTEDLKLEIGITSSMIKELIPLVLYLRYLAQPNDLIVIDEPEMNLHPAAQVEIIEFLAMLVNAGLNILITTHSPYIVDHISNLIAAKKQDNPEKIKECFYLEDTRAFIDQDKVSVYLFEDNTAKNILDKDGSINWETFWDVSSDISGIYAQLLKNRKS